MLSWIKSKTAVLGKIVNSRTPFIAILVIAFFCAATLLVNSVKTIKFTDGVNSQTITTLSDDIDAAMDIAGINKGNFRILNKVTNNGDTTVSLARTFKAYINSGKETIEVETIASTVGEILQLAGIKVDKHDMVEPAVNTKITETAYIDYVNIDYVTGSYNETIPCSVKTVYSNKQAAGTKTLKAGKDGVEKVHYTAKVVDGVTVETVVDSRETVKAAVAATRVIGTAKPATATTSDTKKAISTLKPASPIELDSKGNPVNYKKRITVEATAYTYTGHRCATGVAPQPGYIAVNPKVIPYGTKMYIKSSDGKYTYGYAIAADTGGFIKSRPNNVDLFMSSRQACVNFGRRNVEIYILK